MEELIEIYAGVMTIMFLMMAIKKSKGVSKEEYDTDMDRYQKVVAGYSEELDKSQKLIVQLITDKARLVLEKNQVQNEVLELKYPEYKKIRKSLELVK